MLKTAFPDVRDAVKTSYTEGSLFFQLLNKFPRFQESKITNDVKNSHFTALNFFFFLLPKRKNHDWHERRRPILR